MTFLPTDGDRSRHAGTEKRKSATGEGKAQLRDPDSEGKDGKVKTRKKQGDNSKKK